MIDSPPLPRPFEMASSSRRRPISALAVVSSFLLASVVVDVVVDVDAVILTAVVGKSHPTATGEHRRRASRVIAHHRGHDPG